ncbi:hypothetical protein AD006_32665 (plasmid) [Pseudonocardia sp. EC080610-09]|nr:hypothetical protein AD006_32665 [Pseudonocardia sp. EC080610-09]
MQLDQDSALLRCDRVELLVCVGHHLLPAPVEIGNGVITFAFDLSKPKLCTRVASERGLFSLALLLLVTIELVALGHHRRDIVALLP